MYSPNPAECEYTPETVLTQTADAIAAEAHGATGATYGRNDYIAHPRMTAELLKQAGYGEVVQAAGLLHDVIEDTDETPESLMEKLMKSAEEMGEAEARDFAMSSLIVVKAVIALTKRPGDTFETKIARVRGDSVARIVKHKGDAQSHLDYNRWKVERKIRRPRAVASRIRKYTRTQEAISERLLNPQEVDYVIKEKKKDLVAA